MEFRLIKCYLFCVIFNTNFDDFVKMLFEKRKRKKIDENKYLRDFIWHIIVNICKIFSLFLSNSLRDIPEKLGIYFCNIVEKKRTIKRRKEDEKSRLYQMEKIKINIQTESNGMV